MQAPSPGGTTAALQTPHSVLTPEDAMMCQDSCEQHTSRLFKILLGDFKEEIRNIVQG